MNTIIVVDDDKTFSGLLKTVFEFEGYHVVLVPNANDVVSAVREWKPALVLMDVHAGRADTFGVLRELRADETLKAMPVVMTSGMDHGPECEAAGANVFLLKPFRPSELMALVADLVKG
jgi:CheY-like chemotaxis protein